MATLVERDGAGHTIYRSPEVRTVPQLDLLTFLFDSPYPQSKEDTLLHISAADPSVKVTKALLRTLIKSTAHTLRHAYGVGARGAGRDVVTLVLPGHHLAAALSFAIVAAGGVFSAASQAFAPAELARQLDLGESRLLICHASTQKTAAAAAGQCGLPLDRVLVVGDGTQMDLKRLSDGKAVGTDGGQLDWERITDPAKLKDSLINLIYSSGTTGLPKGVQLSHTNVVSECYVSCQPFREYNMVNRPDFKYSTVGHLPISHVAGYLGYLINPLYHGGPVYWMPQFNFQKFLEYNKTYKITHFFTVPPIYLLIAKSPEVKDHFDTLVQAISGAAPLGKELQNAATAKLGRGQMSISQTYGLSETTGSITLLPNGWRDETGSVSCLVANCQARLVDDDGNDVPPGSKGEVICKGPIVTNGYHNNPKANAESFRDGWYLTGDIAEYRNGMFYIVDRKKELIKYKGTQVAPAELEALLLSHDNIQDAGVIGVDGEGTELPRAYVVADKSKISAEEIEKFVKDRLSGYKQLRGGVVFLDAIPKSASGKILRKDLRDLARRLSGPKL